MKKLLVICPSRIRPHRVTKMLDSFDRTRSDGTDIVIYTSHDDPTLEGYKSVLNGRNLVIGDRIPQGHVCNKMCEMFPNYDYYQEVNDDHFYITPNWDKILIEEIEKNGGWGISWGWGMIHPKETRLPQAVVISGNCVKALGHFFNPIVTHAYVDRIIIDLFEALGMAYYRPDVVIEHQHALNGKGEMDDNYRHVLSGETLEIGRKQYEEWRNNIMPIEIEKIKRAKS